MARLGSLLPLLSLASQALAAGSYKTTLVVTLEDGAPDGFSKPVYKINGTTPGPLIRAHQGDNMEITVINQTPENTTMHWHGVPQWGTIEADGVPGVTQNPIKPGDSFVYRFTAVDAGTYWYHSHFMDQLIDGLSGPLMVTPANPDENPFHLIDDDCDAIAEMQEAALRPSVIFLQDWDHIPWADRHASMQAAGIEDICYTSYLVNGKGRVMCLAPEELAEAATQSPKMSGLLGLAPNSTLTDKGCVPPDVLVAGTGGLGDPSLLDPRAFFGCNATDSPVEVFEAGTDEWVAFDIYAALALVTTTLSIDEHEFYVYAADGHYTEPQKVNGVTLNSGERYSILVKTQTPGDYQVRIQASAGIQVLHGVVVLSVREGHPGKTITSTTTIPDSDPWFNAVGAPLNESIVLFDPWTAAPFPPQPVSQTVDATHKLTMTLLNSSVVWSLNGTTLDVVKLTEKETPLLFESPNPDFQPGTSIFTLNDTWVDLVFSTDMPPDHTIHKHGKHFRLIGNGIGPFPWESVEEAMKEIPDAFNLDNPPVRDSIYMPGPPPNSTAWHVLRWHSTNPGPFLVHCHFHTHESDGMMMVINEGVNAWPHPEPQN